VLVPISIRFGLGIGITRRTAPANAATLAAALCNATSVVMRNMVSSARPQATVRCVSYTIVGSTAILTVTVSGAGSSGLGNGSRLLADGAAAALTVSAAAEDAVERLAQRVSALAAAVTGALTTGLGTSQAQAPAAERVLQPASCDPVASPDTCDMTGFDLTLALEETISVVNPVLVKEVHDLSVGSSVAVPQLLVADHIASLQAALAAPAAIKSAVETELSSSAAAAQAVGIVTSAGTAAQQAVGLLSASTVTVPTQTLVAIGTVVTQPTPTPAPATPPLSVGAVAGIAGGGGLLALVALGSAFAYIVSRRRARERADAELAAYAAAQADGAGTAGGAGDHLSTGPVAAAAVAVAGSGAVLVTVPVAVAAAATRGGRSAADGHSSAGGARGAAPLAATHARSSVRSSAESACSGGADRSAAHEELYIGRLADDGAGFSAGVHGEAYIIEDDDGAGAGGAQWVSGGGVSVVGGGQGGRVPGGNALLAPVAAASGLRQVRQAQPSTYAGVAMQPLSAAQQPQYAASEAAAASLAASVGSGHGPSVSGASGGAAAGADSAARRRSLISGAASSTARPQLQRLGGTASGDARSRDGGEASDAASASGRNAEPAADPASPGGAGGTSSRAVLAPSGQTTQPGTATLAWGTARGAAPAAGINVAPVPLAYAAPACAAPAYTTAQTSRSPSAAAFNAAGRALPSAYRPDAVPAHSAVQMPGMALSAAPSAAPSPAAPATGPGAVVRASSATPTAGTASGGQSDGGKLPVGLTLPCHNASGAAAAGRGRASLRGGSSAVDQAAAAVAAAVAVTAALGVRPASVLSAGSGAETPTARSGFGAHGRESLAAYSEPGAGEDEEEDPTVRPAMDL
jgi:hypothetical protein